MNTISKEQEIQLKISFLNVKGIENNIEYINQLAFSSDVLFIDETWHKSRADIENALYLMGKTTYNCEGPKLENKKGRSHGGYAFIKKEDLNSTFTKINERICQLRINKLVLMGVYLPYLGGKTKEIRESHQFQFDLCLELIKQTYYKNKKLG